MTSVNVTAVVISRYRCCHVSQAAWQFITRSHSTLACGCWSVLMSELSWLVFQGSSWFTLKVQCQQFIIQAPVQDIKFKCWRQRMTTNQLRIICLFPPSPSSLHFLSCWPEKEKESSVLSLLEQQIENSFNQPIYLTELASDKVSKVIYQKLARFV